MSDGPATPAGQLAPDSELMLEEQVVPSHEPELRASSAAQLIAALVPDLPQQTCDHLHALLGLGLASPSPTELREQQLGLLYELIEDSPQEIPTGEDYETERARPERANEKWPTRSQLTAAYGPWLKVCDAAYRLWEEGSRGRVAHTNQHARFDYALYRRKHVVEAIHRFRVKFTHWPTQWEYEDWARLERRVARSTGSGDPRLPTLPRVRKLCSSWDRALALAVRAWRGLLVVAPAARLFDEPSHRTSTRGWAHLELTRPAPRQEIDLLGLEDP